MKIAIFVPSLRNKAPVNVAISIAYNLAVSGNEVTVFYFNDNIEIKRHKQVRFEKLTLFKNINWKNYDIVHSHGMLPDTFIFLKKPIIGKTKAISTIHNYVFRDMRSNYNWIFGTFLSISWLILWIRFNMLVVLNNDVLNYYKSLSINKRLQRIYNGRDIVIKSELISPEYKREIEVMRNKFSYTIGVYSTLIHLKRIDILIRHLSRVNNGCLIVFGEGKERENLENLVEKYNLKDRVKFFGHVNEAHQYNVLFDVFVHSSSAEGSSLSLIEAALHKKKIVCSNIHSFTEAFNNREVTFFDNNNELTIDKAIEEALLNEDKPIKAYNKAIKYYSEKAMSDEYFKLYESLK
ncbi:MAG: glycosyltransferase family 4 protein [Bacteroidota bacterium]